MTEASDAAFVPAAQYVRMSTEHQRYSLENQKSAIAVYAAARGFDIIRTYEDAGKSGLSLRGRAGLRSLLKDTLAPERDFDAILVLDVSRWGRFQDPDQSAHYEFICRRAGVKVAYCGEPFENDGAMASTILKHLKRVMAGEYSRELSAKIRAGKERQARLGYPMGARAGYGFRRQLVDEHGRPRFILKTGEVKALMTDRVIFIHGPIEELETIRRMFRLYVRTRFSRPKIAALLNDERVPRLDGQRWTPAMVRSVLRNELAIGVLAYGKTTSHLRGPKRWTSPDQLIRTKVLPAIVSPVLFRKAQAIAAEHRSYPLPREPILVGLKRLLREKGRLSAKIINDCKYLPSSTTVGKRFGALTKAYAQIGYVGEQWPWQYRFSARPSDADILSRLDKLHRERGYLSTALVTADPELPSPSTLRARFGSLMNAYAAAGHAVTHGHQVRAAMERRVAAFKRAGRREIVFRDPAPPPPRVSDDELLDGLRRLMSKHGYITADLINDDPNLCSVGPYYRRFGSLLGAYAAVGWQVTRSQVNAAIWQRQKARQSMEARP